MSAAERWVLLAREARRPTLLGNEAARALADIDRLRAQVERDRPVIEAARAWKVSWAVRPNGVNAVLYDALTEHALAPDEVNEVQP